MKEVWTKANIGERYQKLSLTDYKGDNEPLVEVKKYISNIHKVRDEGLGMIACGEWGEGKTFLMAEILKAASLATNPRTRYPYTIYMTSLAEIVSMFTDGWYKPAAKEQFNNNILKKDFLLIDDVEKVYIPEKENNVVVTTLDRVLRDRINNCKPVLMTSNETPVELKKLFGPAFASLMAGHLVVLKFDKKEDYRKIHPAKEIWSKLK